MPRVLLISPEPMQAYQGGAGVYLDNVVRCFSRREQYYFDVLNYGNDPAVVHRGPNFTSYRFPPPPLENLLPASRGKAYVQHLLEFLQNQGIAPDIVHLVDVTPMLVPLKSALRVPCVFDLHLSMRQAPDTFMWYNYDAFGRTEPPRAEVQRALWQREQQCMDGADVIVVHSSYYGRLCGRYKHKRIVIHNGIDLGAWRRTSPFALPGNRPRKVVYLGRFDYMKGIDQLLHARVPDEVDLVFYGTMAGRYARAVGAHAATRDEIHYGGALYGQEKVNMLWSADALIFPSRHEPFGIVALEALATKSLALTSFSGGLSEIIPADVGIDCGTDWRSISAALAAFAAMPQHEKSRRVEEGTRLLERFDWTSAANRLGRLYDHLLP